MGRYTARTCVPPLLSAPEWKLFLWTTSLEYKPPEARPILTHDRACMCTWMGVVAAGYFSLLVKVREKKSSQDIGVKV